MSNTQLEDALKDKSRLSEQNKELIQHADEFDKTSEKLTEVEIQLTTLQKEQYVNK